VRHRSNLDVNETASIVSPRSVAVENRDVLICGGGSPKNFMLQTEPQIQEVLGIDEKGHDYFLQITDAVRNRADSPARHQLEAVSWGKIDPIACGRRRLLSRLDRRAPAVTAYASRATRSAHCGASTKSAAR
jgi:deoxyhypusine synthase